MYSNMGPKTTPSLISKGGIDTPWEIGLILRLLFLGSMLPQYMALSVSFVSYVTLRLSKKKFRPLRSKV